MDAALDEESLREMMDGRVQEDRGNWIEQDKDELKRTMEKQEKPEKPEKPGVRRQPATVDTAVSQQYSQRRIYFRKKVCKLCVKKVKEIDYKDVGILQKFITEKGKILPRRITGVSHYYQKKLTLAIKRARQIALLPFVAEA